MFSNTFFTKHLRPTASKFSELQRRIFEQNFTKKKKYKKSTMSFSDTNFQIICFLTIEMLKFEQPNSKKKNYSFYFKERKVIIKHFDAAQSFKNIPLVFFYEVVKISGRNF